MPATATRVAIIGAGVGGLACAIDLARRGLAVTVFERHPAPGGKMRGRLADGRAFDAGPTVLTMPRVFESLFGDAGTTLAGEVGLVRSHTLARHHWPDGSQLDLVADRAENRSRIGAFASARDADGYARFCRDAGRILQTLDATMLRSTAPSMLELVRRCGIGPMMAIKPFRTLWSALGDYFADPRLRQLFGRYATYVGSSPMAAPATLMLIAHLEQEGVWLVEGGMRALAAAMARVAERNGAVIELSTGVASIGCAGGRVGSVRLDNGECRRFDRIVCNADAAALAAGAIGGVPYAVARPEPDRRSLSAVVWTLDVETRGVPLERHNVFFSGDAAREFGDLFDRRVVPDDPTVYVCAQDRPALAPDAGCERLLVLVNAPPGRTGRPPAVALDPARAARLFERLAARGLSMSPDPCGVTPIGPAGFARDYPATGGALYGGVTHGWRSTFRRPGSRTAVPGLYLAGGGVHPGAGVPMAAISGRLAASALMADLGSTRRSRATGISGGMSTPSPTTGFTASR